MNGSPRRRDFCSSTVERMKMKTSVKKREPFCNSSQRKFCFNILEMVSSHHVAGKEMQKIKPNAKVRKAMVTVRAFDKLQEQTRQRAYKRIHAERLRLKKAIEFSPASKALTMADAFYNKYKT